MNFFQTDKLESLVKIKFNASFLYILFSFKMRRKKNNYLSKKKTMCSNFFFEKPFLFFLTEEIDTLIFDNMSMMGFFLFLFLRPIQLLSNICLIIIFFLLLLLLFYFTEIFLCFKTMCSYHECFRFESTLYMS
jgi:hypothetical protein